MAHLDGKERSDYVQDMFDRIAGRYNLMNRIISGGQDLKWRRFVLDVAELPQDGALLDIATGTGDIAFEALKRFPEARVYGADFALRMMQVGRQHRVYGHTGALDGRRCLTVALFQWKFRRRGIRLSDAQCH